MIVTCENRWVDKVNLYIPCGKEKISKYTRYGNNYVITQKGILCIY